MTEAGFPHSGTCGSKRARRSPQHFAGRRALHRLLAPRHPPAALCSLIIHNCLTPEGMSRRSDRHTSVLAALTSEEMSFSLEDLFPAARAAGSTTTLYRTLQFSMFAPESRSSLGKTPLTGSTVRLPYNAGRKAEAGKLVLESTRFPED